MVVDGSSKETQSEHILRYYIRNLIVTMVSCWQMDTNITTFVVEVVTSSVASRLQGQNIVGVLGHQALRFLRKQEKEPHVYIILVQNCVVWVHENLVLNFLLVWTYISYPMGVSRFKTWVLMCLKFKEWCLQHLLRVWEFCGWFACSHCFKARLSFLAPLTMFVIVFIFLWGSRCLWLPHSCDWKRVDIEANKELYMPYVCMGWVFLCSLLFSHFLKKS